MADLQQSLSWWCFKDLGVDAPDLIQAAAKIGYSGIELVEEVHWPAIVDAGLKIISMGGHDSIAEGLNRRENHPRIEKEIRGKIDLAVKWKVPVLICFSGNRHNGSDEEGISICAEGLARVAQHAEQAGVALAVELLNSKVDHQGYQCDHTAWGVQLCERVGSPAVGLLYDIYHMQIMEGDLIRTIRENHRHFPHYHTAGNPGRGPMDDVQEIHYPPIYRAIAETGYAGHIGHEFIPKGDPVTELRRAFEQVRAA